MPLDPGLAAAFATVGITNVARPYPHKLDHLLEGPEPLAADHVARHPVFRGAYDWHSAVHMHWLPLVGDRGDPQIAHRDGLCLSRAWCLRRIATALGRARTPVSDEPRLADLGAAAEANFEPALPHTVGGDYVGEHWLASFAALALGEVP